MSIAAPIGPSTIVVPSGLVAMYNFTHDSGTTVVDEFGDYDLIVNGSVPRVLEGTVYRRDFSGARFNSLESEDTFDLVNWTVVAVWRGNDNVSYQNTILVSFDNETGSDIAPIYFWNNLTELSNDGYKSVPMIGDYGSRLWENTTAWNAGQLYMTTVTANDSMTTIWRDTVRQNYKNIGPVHPCDLLGKLHVGNLFDARSPLAWNGSLYALYVYDRVLTPTEISQIHAYETDRITNSVQSYTLELKAGWNLVSFPVVNTTLKASSLNGTGVSVVASYNQSRGDFDAFAQGSPLIYDITMSTDTGYFFYCTRDTSITVNGQNPAARSKTLVQGWNLIGWSSLTSANASAVCGQTSLPGTQIIAKYNATSGGFDAFADGSPALYDFAMSDGSGYYVYSGSATPLTLYYEGGV